MCSIGKVGIGLVGIESVLAWLVLGWLADDGKGRPAPRANAPLSTPGQVRSKETPAMLIVTTIVNAKLHFQSFQSLFKCNTYLTCQGHYKCL